MLSLETSLFSKGETVAVALSGGADSVCLLHLLLKNSEKLNIKVVGINVEHGIRGEESLKDTEFSVALCEKLGAPVKVFSVDAPTFSKENGYTLEQGARILRYQCFFKAVSEGFCHKIATAHHLDDSVETALFNLFRGSSLTGLKGIDQNAYGGIVVRPLLNAKKSEILEYIEENGLSFAVDSTNFDLKFSRNAIREKILPAIKDEFPSAVEAISKFMKKARSDDEYIYSVAREKIVKEGAWVKIPADLPYPVFSRAAVLALKSLGVEKDYDNRHIDGLFELSFNQSGRKNHLLKGIEGVKEGGYIVLRKAENLEETESVPFSFGENKVGSKTVVAEKISIKDLEGIYDLKNGQGVSFLDLSKIPDGAVFRRKKEGDRIEKFGGGEVSLKKYLTDKKIPAYEKARLVVLAKENKILWVENIDISATVKIDKHTVNIVKLFIS